MKRTLWSEGIKLVVIVAGMLILLANLAMAQQIAVVQDSGENILKNAKNGLPTMKIAANAFYSKYKAKYGDDFDFLFIVMQGKATFNDEGYLPGAYPTAKAPAGTSAPNPSANPGDFGSDGKLKLVGDMYVINNWSTDPNEKYPYYNLGPTGSSYSGYRQLELVARQMMRYWGAYLKIPGSKSDAILGGNGFYSYFFSNGTLAGASVLGGNYLSQMSDKEYTAKDVPRILTPLDQYLMGVIGKDEVTTSLFYLDPVNSENSASDLPGEGSGYMDKATKNVVTMDQIVSANGTRAKVEDVQKYRCAFVLVVPKGMSAVPSDLAKLDTLRLRFQGWVGAQTNNKVTMNCVLEQGADGDADSDQPIGCVEGETRCYWDIVERCDENGDYLVYKNCHDEGKVCDDGECVKESQVDGDGSESSEKECTENQTRCEDNELQTCSREGIYVLTQDCTLQYKTCQIVSGTAQCVRGSIDGDDNPDGDGDQAQPDGDVDPDQSTQTCTVATVEADCGSLSVCKIKNRVWSCEACPDGTLSVTNNVCDAPEDYVEEEGDGGGGCQQMFEFSIPLTMLGTLLLALGLRRRFAGLSNK